MVIGRSRDTSRCCSRALPSRFGIEGGSSTWRREQSFRRRRSMSAILDASDPTCLQPDRAPRSHAPVRLTIGARGRVTDDSPLPDDRHSGDRRHGVDGAVRSYATISVRRDDPTVRDPHLAVPGRRAATARRDAPSSVELREAVFRSPSESRRRAALVVRLGSDSRPRRSGGRRDAATQASPVGAGLRRLNLGIGVERHQQTETRRPEPNPQGDGSPP